MVSVWAAQAAEFIQYDGSNAEVFQDTFGVQPAINPDDGSVTFRSNDNVNWSGQFTLQIGDWAQVGLLSVVPAADFVSKYVPVPPPNE